MDNEPWTLTARWVFPVARPPLERGVVTIAGERIVAVEASRKSKVDVDLGDLAILPGLVNAHTHLDLTGARGQCPPTTDFTQWLRQVVAFRRGRTPEQVRGDIAAGVEQAIASGTTLLGDIASEGVSLSLLSAAACRAVVYYELLGLTQERAEEAIAKARVWCDQSRMAGPRLGLSPHAPYSVQCTLFQQALDMALTHDVPLAVHVAETAEELELLKNHQGRFKRFLHALGVWNPAGLVGSVDELCSMYRRARVLWIHGNYLSGFEDLPSHHSIVYCPRTHAAFGHPPHPFRKFLERGARVALGTDSLASNPDLDILAEARLVRRLHPDLPAVDLLFMLTLAGAEALGYADETGSLAVGKSADLVALPLARVRPKDPQELIFDSDEKVTRVMLRGQWLQNNKPPGKT